MVDTAIILAAGAGSKIWPYGDTWPKAALPIANRPIIHWQIDALQTCGIQNIIVVIGPLGSQIRDAVSGLAGVQCVEQKQPKGTADSLLAGLSFIKEPDFLTLYGDTVFSVEDLKQLLAAHENGDEACALVQSLGSLPPNEWLCANVDNDRVHQILGHPREASHRLCGVYCLSRKLVPYLTNNPGLMTSVEVGNMPSLESELAESLSRFLRDGGTIRAVETQRFFVDVDKPWHILDANSAVLTSLGSKITTDQIASSAVVEKGAEIGGHIVVGENSVIGHDVKVKGNLWVGKNTKITDGAIIGENTTIGDECQIREYCKIEPLSAIGSHCVIGHAAEFGGVLMDGAYSYHYGEYWGVIGRSADLGAATVCGNLRFDDQQTIHHVKGRREIPVSSGANAAYLGDYTRTGVNAILMPGVKVGPYSVVGSGVILNDDVPNKTIVYVKQDQIRSTWGPEKYGW